MSCPPLKFDTHSSILPSVVSSSGRDATRHASCRFSVERKFLACTAFAPHCRLAELEIETGEVNGFALSLISKQKFRCPDICQCVGIEKCVIQKRNLETPHYLEISSKQAASRCTYASASLCSAR